MKNSLVNGVIHGWEQNNMPHGCAVLIILLLQLDMFDAIHAIAPTQFTVNGVVTSGKKVYSQTPAHTLFNN